MAILAILAWQSLRVTSGIERKLEDFHAVSQSLEPLHLVTQRAAATAEKSAAASVEMRPQRARIVDIAQPGVCRCRA